MGKSDWRAMGVEGGAQMTKRWAIVVLISLLLGAVINVGVAWVLLLRYGVPTSQPQRMHKQAEGIAWVTSVPAEWPAAANSRSRVRWWNCTIDDQMVVPVRTPGDQVERHVFGGHWVRVVSWGWPRASLGVVWLRKEPITMDAEGMPYREGGVRGGLPLPTSMHNGPWVTRLPIMPMWAGFAVNTLLYGAISGAVLFGPGMVKRASRRRRGACIGCGYDMVGLRTCPECGMTGRWREFARPALQPDSCRGRRVKGCVRGCDGVGQRSRWGGRLNGVRGSA